MSSIFGLQHRRKLSLSPEPAATMPDPAYRGSDIL